MTFNEAKDILKRIRELQHKRNLIKSTYERSYLTTEINTLAAMVYDNSFMSSDRYWDIIK